MEACKQAVVDLYGKDPKENPDDSRIINAGALRRLAGLIDRSNVILGGRSEEVRRYVAHTILYPVSWSDPVMESEIFGPILPILTYSKPGGSLGQGQVAATASFCVHLQPGPGYH